MGTNKTNINIRETNSLLETDCKVVDGDIRFAYKVNAIIIEDNQVLLIYNPESNYYYLIGGKVKVLETAKEAVEREVWEEAGVEYKADKLLIINENFFIGQTKNVKGLHSHELILTYLMKPRGTKDIDTETYKLQSGEEFRWIDLDDLESILDNSPLYPLHIKDYLLNIETERRTLKHVVTDQR